MKYLRAEHGVPFLSTGDIVREIASTEGVEPTRTNLQEISDLYFREQGEGCFVRLVAEKICSNGWQRAGISGVRSPKDVDDLKGIFGDEFVLIDVYVADPRLRYERMRWRGEGRDAQAYEDFVQQDRAEEELFHTEEATRRADYSLSNDGTLDDLHRAIDGLISGNGLLSI